MSLGTFKVPNRQEKKSKSTHEAMTCKCNARAAPVVPFPCDLPLARPSLKEQHVASGTLLGILPEDRRVTRGSLRAWQEGRHKPWSDLPGLRLRFAESCSTSDYGTASESSYNCSSSAGGFSPPEPCKCENMSGVDCLSSSEDEGIITPPLVPLEEPNSAPMSNCHWNTDSESDDGISTWNDDPHTYSGRVKFLKFSESKITAIIPVQSATDNPIPISDLKIRVLKDEMYKPQCGICLHHVSPVVSMEPHGIQFRPDSPVYLSIPVDAEDERQLVCLYSNTRENEQPKWEKMPKKDFRYRDGFLIIFVNHFSLFTVLFEEPYPESLKRIRRRMGGTLRVNQVPGVEIVFPRGCLDDDVDAYLRVLYDCEPTSFQSSLLRSYALASPIIMIGPHGHKFTPSKPAVIVTLPVPDMIRICDKFQIPRDQAAASLSILQSSTMESEPTVWERLNTQLVVNYNHPSGVPVVSFQVHHFSFFTVIWDLLSTSLYEAKMGVAYYYPYITFSMMCEAFMQETPNTNRFGLEVICYRSDRRLPEMPNLQHRVGSSIKPKLVRPGRILVRLKSQMFEADEDAGEDKDMAKEEPDFRGRDFEKQYACRFKQDLKKDLGAFGKVLVEKMASSGKNGPVFEFNLYKSGHETEGNNPEQSERWTIVAIKELAEHLHITDGNNWKKFAKHIGFTRSEIKSKLQVAADPFLAMMTLYNQRKGTPEEFVQSLHVVSREIHVNLGKNTPPSSSHGSISPSPSGSSSQQQQQLLSPRNRSFPWLVRQELREQELYNSDSTDMPAPDQKRKGQKRSHPSSGNKISSARTLKQRRKQFSDMSETATNSSSDEVEAEDEESSGGEKAARKASSNHSSELHRNNARKLSDRDMWRASVHMGGINWRALGRTLGIEESVLLNLEHSHKGGGVREYAYQMLLEWKGLKPRKCTLGALYTSLCNEKMNAVAKQVLLTNFEEETL